MEKEKIQVIWFTKPKSSAKKIQKSHTSITNKPHKYSKTNKKSIRLFAMEDETIHDLFEDRINKGER